MMGITPLEAPFLGDRGDVATGGEVAIAVDPQCDTGGVFAWTGCMS